MSKSTWCLGKVRTLENIKQGELIKDKDNNFILLVLPENLTTNNIEGVIIWKSTKSEYSIGDVIVINNTHTLEYLPQDHKVMLEQSEVTDSEVVF